MSTSSPWLNLALTNFITDEAYETVPEQLLARLRPDSFMSGIQSPAAAQIKVTGFDDWRYAVQVSTDLANWSFLSTNSPTNGSFSFSVARDPGQPARYYRSVLVP